VPDVHQDRSPEVPQSAHHARGDPVEGGLISDEANDELTPEQIFLTAVDDALDQRQAHRIDKLIRAAKFPIPQASIAEINYQEGRGITPVRMKRYAGHHWRQDPTNLLVLSPTGGGKTYLACAIGIAAC
jgi:DNA replication protein DnaC